MNFETINSVLPLEIINKIVYENKGLTHPTAKIIHSIIEEFEWMDNDYKTVDEKNKIEEKEGDKMSYFLYNKFYNYGF